jgi:hypothetical protein
VECAASTFDWIQLSLIAVILVCVLLTRSILKDIWEAVRFSYHGAERSDK